MKRFTPFVVLAMAGGMVAAGVPAAASAQSLHLAELFAEQDRVDDARAEVLAWFEIRGDDATPDELQHGLWLRGRFAADPAAGRADLERLIEDYPSGRYTGHALTWLALAASDEGDDRRAVTLYRQVVENHPESEVAEPAREWLRARGIAVAEPAPTPRRLPVEPPPTRDPASAQPPTVPVDSAALAFERFVANVDTTVKVPAPPREPARADSAATAAATNPDSGAVQDTIPDAPEVRGATEAEPPPTPTVTDSTPAPADSTPAIDPAPTDSTPANAADSTPADVADSTPIAAEPEPPAEVPASREDPPAADPAPAPVEEFERVPPGPPVPGAATAGAFAVQIGAFRNPVGAGGLVDELITAGFDARLVQVPINDLLRVRIGRFATLEAAQAELARVQAAGHQGAVVSDARRETQVR